MRTAFLAFLSFCCWAQIPPGQQAAFLRDAGIVSTKEAGQGITGSLRATLSLNGVTHDAHIQTINTPGPPPDSYKNNIAAYALGRLLGLDNLPTVVQRTFQGKPASFTWWLDDFLLTEDQRQDRKINPPDAASWNAQVYLMKVFDQLIGNPDRNMGNVLIDGQWRIWLIDHTRAFVVSRIPEQDPDLARCDREFLRRIKTLTAPQLHKAMDPYLSKAQIAAILSRRDFIVRHFQRAAAAQGDARIFYTFLPAR
ncbi:MAG: hypothetical protein HY821_06325 [Acidobacteria bacterium]|nr:hypothetical protein [Acidobacteriota bacterium]